MPTGFSCNLGSRRVRAFNMTGPMCHPVDICVHFGGKLVRRRSSFDYLGGDEIMIYDKRPAENYELLNGPEMHTLIHGIALFEAATIQSETTGYRPSAREIPLHIMVHVSHIIEIVIMPTGFSCNLGSRRVRAFNMTGPMCHPVDIRVHFCGKLVRRRSGFDYLGGDEIMICDVLFRVPRLSICQPYGLLLIQQESDLEWIYRQCEIGDVLDMYLLYDDGDDDEGWYLE
ncbi:hypothetical protein Tco_1560911 [Tanacetum coccineum]